jgi:creatinine amidohydrolase
MAGERFSTKGPMTTEAGLSRAWIRKAVGVRAAVLGIALTLPLLAAAAAPRSSTAIEDMTWTELRERVQTGTTTILVPIGGTEQSGPQIALGKHNQRARLLAAQIAEKLGNAVVAPVVAYVPEGAIDPPTSHMRFPGTISIPEASFEALLEASARSFCRHGLHEVVLLGDHGGYIRNLESVAARFDRAAQGKPVCHVHALTAYYRVTQTAFVDALKARGFTADEIGTHAGLADTALSMALAPESVRHELLVHGAAPRVQDGVHGDPRRATAELGQLGVQLIVDASVKAIRAIQQASPAAPLAH